MREHFTAFTIELTSVKKEKEGFIMSEPKVAQKAPYAVTVEKGKEYHYCTCGLSKNQPFCDVSHKGTDFKPLAFTADETKEVHLCGCKHTSNPPFCDGTHRKL